MKGRRYGIRARITGGSLLIAIAFSIIAGLIIYTQVERIVTNGTIAVLRADAAPYEAAIHDGSPLATPGPGQYIAVIDPSGTAVINTLPEALSGDLDEVLAGPDATHVFEVDGSEYLIRDAEITTSAGEWHVLSARNAAPQQEVLAAMTVLLIVSIAVINIAFGVATWLLTTAALRPVRRMRASAEALAAEGGSELLPAGPPDDEIAELARTLNDLIDRLRSAADRERQIVSDASHELRTPLALVRTRLEVARVEASSVEQLTADIATAEAALDRLARLADSLLELSRVDAGAAVASEGTATISDLAGELADSVDRGRLRASHGEAVVEYEDRTAAGDLRIVPMSVRDFARITDNLVSNALAALNLHGGGRVALSLDIEEDGPVLRVSDTGGGMPPEFLPRAFERFSRASTSRTGSGSGLGLAIVQGLVDAAGGRIELLNDPGVGLTAVVRLPWEGSG